MAIQVLQPTMRINVQLRFPISKDGASPNVAASLASTRCEDPAAAAAADGDAWLVSRADVRTLLLPLLRLMRERAEEQATGNRRLGRRLGIGQWLR